MRFLPSTISISLVHISCSFSSSLHENKNQFIIIYVHIIRAMFQFNGFFFPLLIRGLEIFRISCVHWSLFLFFTHNANHLRHQTFDILFSYFCYNLTVTNATNKTKMQKYTREIWIWSCYCFCKHNVIIWIYNDWLMPKCITVDQMFAYKHHKRNGNKNSILWNFLPFFFQNIGDFKKNGPSNSRQTPTKIIENWFNLPSFEFGNFTRAFR